MNVVEVAGGFLLGILGAGAGALWHAQVTKTERRAELVLGLRTELEEDLASLERHRAERRPGRLHRAAWDQARALALGPEARIRLTRAYILVDNYNLDVDVQWRQVGVAGGMTADFQKVVASRVDPGETCAAIKAALTALPRS